MKKVFYIFQILLKCFLIFVICFIWLRYSNFSPITSIAISTVLSLTIHLVSKLIFNKRNEKGVLKTKQSEKADQIYDALVTIENPIDFFFGLFKTRHSEIKKNTDFLLLTIDNEKILFYPFLKVNELSPDDLLNIIKKTKKISYTKAIIFCGGYKKECEKYVNILSKDITILDKQNAYIKIFEEYQYFPELPIMKKKTIAQSIKELISYAFNKNKTKGYVLSALVVLSLSTIAKSSIYYYIISSLLLFFAFICLTSPNINVKKELL